MFNINRYSLINGVALTVFIILSSSISINAETTTPSCTSEKTKKLVLVDFIIEPQRAKGINVDVAVEKLSNMDKGNIDLGRENFNFTYSDGDLAFTKDDISSTMHLIIDNIKAVSLEKNTNIVFCEARFTMTVKANQKKEDIFVGLLKYKTEITNNNKHVVEIEYSGKNKSQGASYRSKAPDSMAKQALKTMATAQERYYVDNSTYTSKQGNLSQYGWTAPTGVTVVIIRGNKYGWSATARSNGSSKTFTYDSARGGLQ